MRRRWSRWRARQPSRILYVPVAAPGSTIVASGLKKSRYGIAMVEYVRTTL